MDSKISLPQVIAMGGAFMGFVIGSSFASGQECLQYFSGHGVWGSIGVGIIALILYVWFNTVIIEDGRNLRLKQTKSLNIIWENIWELFVSGLLQLCCFLFMQ